MDVDKLALAYFGSDEGYEGLTESMFALLVEVADRYVRLTDPEDRVELEFLSMWPDLVENLDIRRNGRVVGNFLMLSMRCMQRIDFLCGL